MESSTIRRKAGSSYTRSSYHCMRCHQTFESRSNDALACVMLTPYPFHGPHTMDAKQVDYTKFDICDSYACGTVLHSFTFHLKMIQEEKECQKIEEQLKKKDEDYVQDLEDQLELLQILKLTRASMSPQAQKQNLNEKWERTIDYQYYKVMAKMIRKHQADIELEEFTNEMMKKPDDEDMLLPSQSMKQPAAKGTKPLSKPTKKLRSPLQLFQSPKKKTETTKKASV